MNDDIIYLDHAAATPVDEQVLFAMQPYMSGMFFNPSSPYEPARQVRRDYEAAKDVIARAIGAKGDELVMTAGATESISLAFSVSGHKVISAIEHQAVFGAASRGDYTTVPVDRSGRIGLAELRRAITDKTTLVSIGLANSEIGTIQPLSDIAKIVAEVRSRRLESGNHTPLWLHSDASQGLGQIDINVARLGLDMLTLNAGKVYGPKQVGLLYVARQVALSPQINGGGQEQGLRSGTENVPGVIGFARAIELAEARRKAEVSRLTELRNHLRSRLVEQFPEAVVSGNKKHQLAGHLHISFPGIDAERLVFMLEMKQVLVATGSACAANKGTRSHVLTAIGLEPELADGSLRLTLGRTTDRAKVDRAADEIIKAVASEQQRVRAR